ncbi:MAG: sialidase family protein, partial [Anaerohalosphaeraceae bacterium]
IWDDADNTCGNPCVVQDRKTGMLWLFATWNLGADVEHMIDTGQSRDTRRVFILKSPDDGLTWSKPQDMTADVKPKNWRWYATGPGIGIQLQSGPHKGRLLIPSNHSVPRGSSMVSGSHVIYSDDAGTTWKLSEPIYPGCNESQAVELSDGRVLMNMRNYQHKGSRAVAISSDGGQTWPEVSSQSNLIELVCQASILRLPAGAGSTQSVIVFSNPHHSSKRVNMTVQASLNDCKTWPYARSLTDGPAAYSCLGQLPDNRIACLYETGDKNPYRKIVLATFNLDWLMTGTVQPPNP